MSDSVKNRKRGSLIEWTMTVEPVPIESAPSPAAAFDLALLAWVDLGSSDDDNPLATQAADDLALMMME